MDIMMMLCEFTFSQKVVLLLNLLAVLSRWWAQAAVYAHKAYKDEELLNNAVATWNSVSR